MQGVARGGFWKQAAPFKCLFCVSVILRIQLHLDGGFMIISYHIVLLHIQVHKKSNRSIIIG
jgi:hypothetical protein